MGLREFGRISVPVLLGLSLFAAVWFDLRDAGAGALFPQTVSSSTLGRPEDPVVVAGANFSILISQPVDELALYAFDSGGWSPIPFQIDERANDITGTYVISEDGLLDANDELVFMAKDAGQLAGAGWPADVEAQQNVRYGIEARDPLDPGASGWAYLYRSTTLPADPTTYVHWDEPQQVATAVSYTASFSPSAFVGLADLTINGNPVDILDRQKTRVTAFILTFTEEDLIAFVTPTISIPVVGPIRGVANGGGFNLSIYGERFEFSIAFNTSALPLTIDNLRTSLDLNDPSLTGIANYYDSNGAMAKIDGSPDTVPAGPLMDWYQASGATGGLFVAFPTLNTGGGTASNYYKDDSQLDLADTGDGRSYGDTGLSVANPGNVIELSLVSYILPPGTVDNVGASYFERTTNPLTAVANAQFFKSLTIDKMGPAIAAAGEPVTYTLTVANNLTSTLTSVVITDALPINANYVSGGTLVGSVVSWTVASLTAGETISPQFVVTATETITNSDYRVSSGEGFSATGSHPVVTIVEFPVTGLAATNNSPTVIGNATKLTATISTGTNVHYTWDFDDGQNGNGSDVAHTYPASGIYTAVVTASNSVNSLSTSTEVNILDESISGLAASNDSPTEIGSPTNMTATITAGTNVTYAWAFGDGETGSGPVTTHTYPAAGMYTAIVTATNSVSTATAPTIVTITEAHFPIYIPYVTRD